MDQLQNPLTALPDPFALERVRAKDLREKLSQDNGDNNIDSYDKLNCSFIRSPLDIEANFSIFYLSKIRMGKEIENYLDSDFEKAMFERYWYAEGDYRLTKNEFERIVETGIRDGNNISLYLSPEFDLAIGTGTIYTNEAGNITGFHDRYDFNFYGANRELKNNIQVGLVGFFGLIYGAKDFNIDYDANIDY